MPRRKIIINTDEVTTDDTLTNNTDSVFPELSEEEEIIPELPYVEEDTNVYFNSLKQAHLQKIPDFICTIPKEQWEKFQYLQISKDYDIVDGEFVDLRQTPEYVAEKLDIIRNNKLAENTAKAKQAVDDGFVVFKDAQFETNSQTVGDLTATMLMLQAQQNPEITYNWLSKDDKAVELTLEDFITLGNLIAEFKNTIWSKKYLDFKQQIENAQTLEELKEIEINYGDFDV